MYSAQQFQFHNGSIKSFIEETEETDYTTFQFHNGSIKSQGYFDSEDVSQVSIPQWFD